MPGCPAPRRPHLHTPSIRNKSLNAAPRWLAASGFAPVHGDHHDLVSQRRRGAFFFFEWLSLFLPTIHPRPGLYSPWPPICRPHTRFSSPAVSNCRASPPEVMHDFGVEGSNLDTRKYPPLNDLRRLWCARQVFGGAYALARRSKARGRAHVSRRDPPP